MRFLLSIPCLPILLIELCTIPWVRTASCERPRHKNKVWFGTFWRDFQSGWTPRLIFFFALCALQFADPSKYKPLCLSFLHSCGTAAEHTFPIPTTRPFTSSSQPGLTIATFVVCLPNPALAAGSLLSATSTRETRYNGNKAWLGHRTRQLGSLSDSRMNSSHRRVQRHTKQPSALLRDPEHW